MNHGYNGGQPGVSFVGDDGNDAYQPEAYYDEVFPEAKPATKKGKKGDKNDKNDKSTKEKKPATPIVPTYEGYLFTVLDATRPGETASWVRTHKTQMPFTSQELYDKAMAHKKDSGLGVSGQFQALGPNQREIVNRLVAEKNATEKEANAVWTRFEGCLGRTYVGALYCSTGAAGVVCRFWMAAAEATVAAEHSKVTI